MATDLKALKLAIKLVADLAMDTKKAMLGGGTIAAVLAYQNIIGDIASLAPQIGQLPKEVGALAPNDYVQLVSELAADLAISDAHTGSIIAAALDVLHVVIEDLLPKLEAVIGLVKKPAAA